MKTFTLWYNNGTGYYEGPYPTEAETLDEAINKAHLRWCVNMYGVGAVLNREDNPNYKELRSKTNEEKSE